MSRTTTLPAPVRGWIENENLADNNGLGMSVAENVFPLPSTVRVRGGHLPHANVGAPVKSLMAYRTGTTQQMFATTADDLFNVSEGSTTGDAAEALWPAGDEAWPLGTLLWFGFSITELVPLDPMLEGFGGVISYVQMDTGGTQPFLIAANGSDPWKYYDGTDWDTAIAVTGVSTADLFPIWIHNNRLWGIEAGSMRAWFFAIDSLGGTATDFNLGTVFDEGGSLYLGATWSSDSGSGMDDRCVFVSSEGEVAVYAGTDPADADAWGKVGTYKIARPVSRQTIKAGGDLLLLTEDGIVAMSAVISKDPIALAASAVTYSIEPAWRRLMDRNSLGAQVQAMKWPKEGMILVGYPHAPTEMHVANARTGAWARWTGHDVQCMALHQGQAYFGDSAGYVSLFEGAGSDRGENYVVRMSLLPDHLNAPGAYKTVHKARATFRALAPFKARLSVATDYRREFPTPPNAEADAGVQALWDVGIWDASRWDDSPDSEQRQTRTTRWKSIGRSGFAVAGQVQITCGSTRKPDAELVAIDLLYEVGAVVV